MKIKTPFVIGHRGAAGHAPENTIAGFKKAASLGVQWVEFDVRLTRDGVPIVFHDESLERTTDGRGKVSAQDWEEIQNLDAGKWFANEFSGEPIPTLEQALKAINELNLGANVEMKASPGREVETGHAVVSLLKKHWPRSMPSLLISSFNRDCLAAAKEEASEFSYAFIVGKVPPDWSQVLVQLECEGLHCKFDKLNETTAQEVLKQGYSLRCYTVNINEQAQKLADWGVQSIFTDYPDRIKN